MRWFDESGPRASERAFRRAAALVQASILLVYGLLMGGCTAQSSLVPIERGRVVPHVAFGGPMVEAFDTHIPVPWLAAGADIGVGRRVTASVVAHLLPLAYRIAGVDVGATWFPWETRPSGQTVGFGAKLTGFASLKSGVEERFLLFPVFTALASRPLGDGRVFAGSDLTVPLARPDYDDEAADVIVSPFVGVSWPISGRLSMTAEFKWHGANVRSDRLVTGYTPIAKYGAITPLFALQRRF